MNKKLVVERFRQGMAEKAGVELTPAEADTFLNEVVTMLMVTKNSSQCELWNELECLRENGKWPDGSPIDEKELVGLLDLIAYVKET